MTTATTAGTATAACWRERAAQQRAACISQLQLKLAVSSALRVQLPYQQRITMLLPLRHASSALCAPCSVVHCFSVSILVLLQRDTPLPPQNLRKCAPACPPPQAPMDLASVLLFLCRSAKRPLSPAFQCACPPPAQVALSLLAPIRLFPPY